MDASERKILLTGFPTFVARQMLQRLAHEEPRAFFYLLVRPDFVDLAAEHLQQLDLPRGRYQLLAGDVVALDLGLSGREYLELIAHVTDIFHIASVWYLGADKAQVWDVNVEGTRNVLDAAHEMKQLQRLNHFSTAYVSGSRTGVIMEDELDEGQSFRNTYERTKFEAEKLVRASMPLLDATIYRPSVIVGDSRTGEIDRMAGPYYLMNAMVQMPHAVPILMPGKGDKPLNLVPIDYVCEAMARLSLDPEAAGRTFHLCDPNPLSAARVFELVAETTGRRAPVGHVPYSLSRLIMRIPYLERFTTSPRHFVDDFNQLTIYNSLNTTQLLSGRVRCPPLPEYIAALIRYIKSASDDFDLDLQGLDELLG